MHRQTRTLTVEVVSLKALKPYLHNARKHTKKQIAEIAGSMKTFGWTVPILVDADMNVVAGHGRLEAAKLLGFQKVPTIGIADMSDAKIRAYRLADNSPRSQNGTGSFSGSN